MSKDISCKNPPLIMEVIQAGKCPLAYKVGDKFKISYPSIKQSPEKSICFLALTAASEALSNYLEKKEDACFECPSCAENKVKFQLYDAPHNTKIHQQIADQLSGFSLFRLMKQDELQSVAKEIHLKKFKEGEIILDIGDAGENFYIIHLGDATIFNRDKANPEKLVKIITLGPEDCFGEMSLLTGEPCSTRVVAGNKTTVLKLSKDAFMRMIYDCPAISKYFFQLMANRLKAVNDQISRKNLVGGIAGSLSTLSLVEIIQIFKSAANTGVLHLSVDLEEAEIFIQNGEIFSARYVDKINEDAFFALVRLNQGEFRFERKPGPFQKEINIPTTGLLMESMRTMDEGI